jgi:hypothetical protein
MPGKLAHAHAPRVLLPHGAGRSVEQMPVSLLFSAEALEMLERYEVKIRGHDERYFTADLRMGRLIIRQIPDGRKS